jgi:cytochrome c553
MRNRLLMSTLGIALASTLAGGAIAQGEPPAANAEPATVAAPAAEAPAAHGDATAGQTKAAVCAACHGLDGNSADPMYPKVAGQNEAYVARQLGLYKSGVRNNAIMLGFVTTLSAQDMRDIGAYFATQKAAPGLASDEKIPGLEETFAQRGERLWRGGHAGNGVPACMACHGPAGAGVPGTGYPALAGQHANYTKARLQAFRDGELWGDDPNAAIMPTIARQLDDADIEALSSYIEGLHPAQPAVASSD